ncbi:carbonic anhydrase [Gymnopilus junonius]|uniref:Carbonic anhydrase n=1 Tax=Gymnopilus junonius TaxID=109634 RepID=A0A9P5TL11_GYMJU|nr:carbonic anhydrase [Gymnopilus junonius]
MFTFTIKSFSVFAMLALFMHMVSAHPVVIGLYPRAPSPAPSDAPQHAPVSQKPLTASNSSVSSTRSHTHTMQELYNGNKRFRQNVLLEVAKPTNDTPSFMFIGCVDNRLIPSTIFNTPPGSITSHNNIGNQYSSHDHSADAAVAYAVESLHVQHIIVLGHYGCKSVENAITKAKSASRHVRDWIRSISELYRKSRRQEIVLLRESRMPRRGQDKGVTTAPPATDSGFRALVEENVKRSVKELRKHSILTQAYSRHSRAHDNLPTDVFVHGFVYNEGTGRVHDLNVSFGPPGKEIPTSHSKLSKLRRTIMLTANRTKVWDFGKGH